jgi:uncharacterized protein YjeT (DUF2065 family)
MNSVLEELQPLLKKTIPGLLLRFLTSLAPVKLRVAGRALTVVGVMVAFHG